MAACNIKCISIHALREEGDHRRQRRGVLRRNFYPRPPRGGRPRTVRDLITDIKFLSTPSARRATGKTRRAKLFFDISIHALREEGDRRRGPLPPQERDFYPRPPRGGRQLKSSVEFTTSRFLSTPSARRATLLVLTERLSRKDFYPRPPRGGRPCNLPIKAAGSQFLSTPSARRATREPEAIIAYQIDFYPRPPRGGRHGQVKEW